MIIFPEVRIYVSDSIIMKILFRRLNWFLHFFLWQFNCIFSGTYKYSSNAILIDRAGQIIEIKFDLRVFILFEFNLVFRHKFLLSSNNLQSNF